MSFRYENQGRTSYLIYEAGEEEQIDSIALGMLTNNLIPGFAKTVYTQVDKERFFKFDVTAKVSASQFFSGTVNQRKMLGLLRGIVKSILQTEDYMLDPKSVVLDLEYVFVNVATLEIVCICLPLETENEPDYRGFFEKILNETVSDINENRDYRTVLLNYLEKDGDFSLFEFSDLLENSDDPMFIREQLKNAEADGVKKADISRKDDQQDPTQFEKETIAAQYRRAQQLRQQTEQRAQQYQQQIDQLKQQAELLRQQAQAKQVEEMYQKEAEEQARKYQEQAEQLQQEVLQLQQQAQQYQSQMMQSQSSEMLVGQAEQGVVQLIKNKNEQLQQTMQSQSAQQEIVLEHSLIESQEAQQFQQQADQLLLQAAMLQKQADNQTEKQEIQQAKQLRQQAAQFQQQALLLQQQAEQTQQQLRQQAERESQQYLQQAEQLQLQAEQLQKQAAQSQFQQRFQFQQQAEHQAQQAAQQAQQYQQQAEQFRQQAEHAAQQAQQFHQQAQQYHQQAQQYQQPQAQQYQQPQAQQYQQPQAQQYQQPQAQQYQQPQAQQYQQPQAQQYQQPQAQQYQQSQAQQYQQFQAQQYQQLQQSQTQQYQQPQPQSQIGPQTMSQPKQRGDLTQTPVRPISVFAVPQKGAVNGADNPKSGEEKEEKKKKGKFKLFGDGKKGDKKTGPSEEKKKREKTVKPEKEKKSVGGTGFAIPGQTAPITSKQSKVGNAGQPVNAQEQNRNQQSMTPIRPAQVPVRPISQPVEQQAVIPRSNASTGVNFGETTMLGVTSGETTVLNATSIAPPKIQPRLIRLKTNEIIRIDKPVFRIGKEKSYVDYFVSDNTAISRSHANIITRENRYWIVDTNSTNHTFVNGKIIASNTEIEITHGTKLRLANDDFEFLVN